MADMTDEELLARVLARERAFVRNQSGAREYGTPPIARFAKVQREVNREDATTMDIRFVYETINAESEERERAVRSLGLRLDAMADDTKTIREQQRLDGAQARRDHAVLCGKLKNGATIGGVVHTVPAKGDRRKKDRRVVEGHWSCGHVRRSGKDRRLDP